jgi:hypothetical protein
MVYENEWPHLLRVTVRTGVVYFGALILTVLTAPAAKATTTLWLWVFPAIFFLGPISVVVIPIVVAIRRKQPAAIIFLIGVVSVVAAAVAGFFGLIVAFAIAGAAMSLA